MVGLYLLVIETKCTSSLTFEIGRSMTAMIFNDFNIDFILGWHLICKVVSVISRGLLKVGPEEASNLLLTRL